MSTDTTNQTATRCVVCLSCKVEEFLNLGETALANEFLKPEEIHASEAKFPLRAGFCHACGHVQLMQSVAPRQMFDNYLYISSASDTLKNHLWDLSDRLVNRYQLSPSSLVVDIGCNDGTLLRGFKRHGVRALGVDPAQNLAGFTAADEIERHVDLFTSSSAKEIVSIWGPASLATATNTFPHIQDLGDFVEGIQIALAPGGALVIEMHYLLDMIEQTAFDTIYHEHISYWALGPMKRLFESHGMTIVDAERVPLHHGQLRVHIQRGGQEAPHERIAEILAAEKAAGLDRFETYLRFGQRTQKIKTDLRRTLEAFARDGQRVAGYGAPAKGNTLLGFLDIGPDLLPYIVDRSPLKQGLYTPGTHIPVLPPQRLVDDQPDYVLLLAWNFLDEIVDQQQEYIRRGGKFIIPVPEVRIVQ